MKRRLLFWTGIVSLVASFPLFAEGEAKPASPGWGADLAVDVVSNYVWRGYDVNQAYFDQKGKKYSSFNTAPALQPTITVKTPLDGLTVNIWGSMTMVGRDDKDADKRLQVTPGGANILTASSNPVTNATMTPIISTTGVSPTAQADFLAMYTDIVNGIKSGGAIAYYAALNNKGGLPGFYKEANGTKRVDEMDYTVNYSTSGKLGTVNVGLISYYLPNVVSVGAHAQTELYLTYALPFFSDLTLSMYDDVRDSDQYYKLGYAHSFTFAESTSVSLGASAAYGVISVPSKRQGMMDVAGNVTFNFHGLRVGANVIYRPDTYMYDTDTVPGNVPAWMDGASNSRDGMVADPSKNYGLGNELVNGIASQWIATTSGFTRYAYTPKQKLPKTLYWFSVGYSTSI